MPASGLDAANTVTEGLTDATQIALNFELVAKLKELKSNKA